LAWHVVEKQSSLTEARRTTVIQSNSRLLSLLVLVATFASSGAVQGQDNASAVPVTMTVTVNVAPDKQLPQIRREEVIVKLNGKRVPVTEWVPAQGDRAGLDLFVLIDDASDTTLGAC
jgi:hypothetical protein